MAEKCSQCPHVRSVRETSWDDVFSRKNTQTRCESCHVNGPNLWLCLHPKCLFTACGESASDHSEKHFQQTKHVLTLNLTTMRIWCYACECEVMKNNNKPPLMLNDKPYSNVGLSSHKFLHSLQVHNPIDSVSNNYNMPNLTAEQESDDDNDDDDDENNTKRPRGLTGLQNLGNTCYMNAALQSLSNCPPLTQFFLECPGFVPAADKRVSLSNNYETLISKMWNKKRPGYVVPSTIVQAIKTAHPMFRGYTQQDSQEFLRCFMDKLHEEMKQPVVTNPALFSSVSNIGMGDSPLPVTSDGSQVQLLSRQITEGDDRSCSSMERSVNSDSNSPSESDYDTCDTGGERIPVDSDRLSSVSITLPLNGMSEEMDNCETLTTSDDTGIGLIEDNTSNSKSLSVENNLFGRRSKSEDGIATNHTENNLNECPQKEMRLSHSYGGHSLKVSTSLTQIMPTIAQQQTVGPEGDGLIESNRLEMQARDGSTLQLHPEKMRKLTNSESESSPRMSSAAVNIPTATKKAKTPIEYSSVISDIFDGKISSSVQCLTCERVSVTKETFQDLSLPIPSKDHLHMLELQNGGSSMSAHRGSCGDVALNKSWMNWMFGWMKGWIWGPTVSLQHCLAAFFSADELKGDNMYSCDKCQKLRNGVKNCQILKLPEILCIHLKRFRHDFVFSTKINTFISFPLEDLNMTPYLHKDCKDAVTEYDLVAIICHHGTAGGGHYTAYAMNDIDAQWYEFDDQFVTRVDVHQVENCDAYVLFYRKKKKVPTATLR